MRRLAPILLTSLVCASFAVAQTNDDWSTPFPPSPPPVEEPTPDAGQLTPTPQQRPVETLNLPSADAGTPGDGTIRPFGGPPAHVATTEESPEYEVISQQERLVEEQAHQHSPSTIHHEITDPRNLRITSAATGTVGLLNVGSADVGPRGLLRVSITGEYFQSNNFPVKNAQDTRTAGTFAVAITPLTWLEAYFAYGASANTNSRSSPALIQTLGDISLGVKLARHWTRGFYGGVDLRGQTFSGVGSQDVSRYAFGFAPRLVGTYDFRELSSSTPLRIHANAGIALDGTGNLVRQNVLNSAEEYALNINKYDRFLFGVGAEVPLPIATPFVEYHFDLPLGTPANGLATPDGKRISVTSAMPQVLAIGVKVTAIQDLTLTAAADIGLARGVGAGVPATEPFNLYFGASYNFDPFEKKATKYVETLREKEKKVAQVEEPKTTKVAGTVVDAQTKQPIPGVIVAMVGTGLPPVASDAPSGRFLTHELPAGQVKLAASKEGYKPAETDVQLVAGQQSEVQVALEPEAKPTSLALSATANGKPVTATVKVHGGPKDQDVALTDKGEPQKLEVAPGKYTLEVNAEGYLSQTRDVQLGQGEEMQVAFTLQAQPKKKLVVVRENKIEILQQVHFAFGKATILQDSYQLLDQVVDAIIKSNIKRVRVEGHTDNKGSKSKNQKLSEDRARAVADYLIKSGIDASRIEALGYGDSRPIAPNLTERGRSLNRRVEFVILER